MKQPWSAMLLTTLIGAGQGLFLVVFFIDAFRTPPGNFVLLCGGVTLLLLALGLIASFFHLGRPDRAWRAATQWRTSWQSREVIVLPALMGCVFLYMLSNSLWVGAVAAVLCVALFVCTAMIYASLEYLQEWHSPFTLPNFVLLGLASGLTLSVPLAVIAYPQFAGPLSLGAFGLAGIAWLARGASLIRNARLRPKSAPGDNTREFFHHRPAWVVHAVRWSFLLLLFPVPAWLLGWGGGSLDAFIAAFVLQFAGVLAERWCFFAEARHPQDIYDQSMA